MRVDQYFTIGGVEKPILKAEKKPEKEEIGSFWDTLKKFGRMLKQRKILGFLPFMIQAGLFQGYALGALYRLTAQVYKGTDKSEAFVKRMICIVQISFAVVAFTTSRVSKTISSGARYWAIKLSSILLMAIMVANVLVFDYLTHIYMVFVPAVILGMIDIGFTQLTSVYLSENFPGQIEAFLVFKQCQNLFTCVFMGAYIQIDKLLFLYIHAGVEIFLCLWLLIAFIR